MSSQTRHCRLNWRHRLSVRTADFHSAKRGSTPRGVTMIEKLFLTGAPHTGKSTLVSNLYERYPSQIVGITAKEIKGPGHARIGFTSGTFANPYEFTIAHLARIDPKHEIGRYSVSVNALDKVADLLAAQFELAKSTDKVLVFDELGLMQQLSQKLQQQVGTILNSDIRAILTIRMDDKDSKWLRELKNTPNTRTHVLTEENRGEVLEELSHYVLLQPFSSK